MRGIILLTIVLVIITVACGTSDEELPTIAATAGALEAEPPATAIDTPGAIEQPTDTPEPVDTDTPEPPEMPIPSDTPEPMSTQIPTNTSIPSTNTPVPPSPTSVPPTNTPIPLPTNTPIPLPTNTPIPLPTNTVPAPIAAVCDCSGNIYNCSDFSTHSQAQACFNYCSPIAGDVHDLDRDNDGQACVSLP